MKKQKSFQIHLDPDLIEEFHASLNAHEQISEQISFMEKAFKKKSYRGVPAWDCICACEHRIRDTVGYLNDQVLGKMEHGSAFDFINFINNASVVLDSIDMLAKILGVDLSQEDARTDAFNMVGLNGEGTDKKYFEFLRSLCAVHPVETNRYKNVFHTADIVTCPYLVWVNKNFLGSFWNCDLHGHAFINEANSWGKDICIHIDQVFAHIKYRYSLLNKIGCTLERFQESRIEEFRTIPVPARAENESEPSYVERLKNAEIERFGANNAYVYDFAKRALLFNPSNPANKIAAERYKNAWRFAIESQRNVLQNMSRLDANHTEIESGNTDWALHLEYCYCDCHELAEFSYNLETINYLDGASGKSNAIWGRAKLEEMDRVLGKHIVFDYDNDSDEELYMLSRIALYEIAFKHNCEINETIPHGERYRP